MIRSTTPLVHALPRQRRRMHTGSLLWISMLLIGCGTPSPLTIDAARATATITGCWPGHGTVPTLLPVTVTPYGGFVATPDPALPTPTALPTTTPYPWCDEGVPTTTPPPTHAPYPTRPAGVGTGGETAIEVVRLPDTILQVAVAVHPTAWWPAVGAVAAPLVRQDDPRVFVRAFNPITQRWGTTQSLGSGGSGLLRSRFRTLQIAISANDELIAVWGVTKQPRLGLMSSISRDYGETWSTPQAIAQDTYGVLGLAVTLDGHAAALTISEAQPQQPLLIRRTPDGQWLTPEPIPVPAWYGSSGAILIRGDGDQATVVVATSGGGASSADNTLFVSTRTLIGGPWTITRLTIPSPDARSADLLTHLHAIPVGERGVLVGFGMAGRTVLYTTLSRDMGATWSAVQTVVATSGRVPPYLALAHDPIAQRSIIFWTCCQDATFVGKESTHYATWGDASTGQWQPEPGQLGTPLITQAIAAADTASAQAPNDRQVWLAWVEQVHSVRVRAFDLDQIAPSASRPVSTPTTPTTGGQP